MKKSELEKIIEDLDLKCSISNNFNTIMQVWPQYNNNGIKVGSKYYSAEVLCSKNVIQLNSKFEKLKDILIKERIILRSSYIIENGLISEWVLEIKGEKLKNLDDDFEIDIEMHDIASGIKEYNASIPDNDKVGFKFDDTTAGVLKERFKYKLKKHEKEEVLSNIDELLDTLTFDENINWMNNFCIEQNSIDPFKYVVENNIIKPKTIIEKLFNSNEYYLQSQYKKLISYLSTIKIKELVFYENGRIIGEQFFPSFIVESPTIFTNILKNWEFTRNTGQKILLYLVQKNYIKQFKQFIKLKDHSKYYFCDWFLKKIIIEEVCDDDPKYLKKLIKDGWMILDSIYYGDMIFYLTYKVNVLNIETYIIVLNEFLKHYQYHEDLLFSLLTKFDESDLHNTEISKNIMNVFIKNTNLNRASSFITGNGAILLYLEDNHPIKKELLNDKQFLSFLFEKNKEHYIPEVLRDVFIF